MITALPAVQYNCKRARRWINYSILSKRQDKRIANRHYRRALNRATQSFLRDPDLFYSEAFEVPSMSAHDIW